jgi:peptide/nickel transport system permease protein
VRQYILRRLLQSVVILFVLSVVVFLLLRIAPGADPALIKCGLNCPEERLEAIRRDLGLDDPYFPINFTGGATLVEFHASNQYMTWLESVFDGSLGIDYNQQAVGPELKARLPVTIELLVITFLVTVAVGVPFGIVSAVFRNSPADYIVRLVAIIGLAVPSFWVAALVLLLPQVWWNYAPPLTQTVSFFGNPSDNLRQFIPPGAVLGAVSAAGVMRLMRSSMLEVMRQDYIRTARSKGLREPLVIGRHALKNSVIPVVTVLGLQLAGLFGGSVIIENVFNLQGIGNYFLGALVRKDYQVVQTLTLYIGAVVVLLNLGVDVLYAWLDPRIRYS